MKKETTNDDLARLINKGFSNQTKHFDEKIDGLENRLCRVEDRVDGFDDKFEGLATKIDHVDQKLSRKIDNLNDATMKRVERIEGSIGLPHHFEAS